MAEFRTHRNLILTKPVAIAQIYEQFYSVAIILILLWLLSHYALFFTPFTKYRLALDFKTHDNDVMTTAFTAYSSLKWSTHSLIHRFAICLFSIKQTFITPYTFIPHGKIITYIYLGYIFTQRVTSVAKRAFVSASIRTQQSKQLNLHNIKAFSYWNKHFQTAKLLSIFHITWNQ